MPLDASTEPSIDTSLSYYLEERALAIALVKAGSPAQHASHAPRDAPRGRGSRPEQKLGSKRAVVTALTEVRAALTALPADGRAQFEIDL
jgi:hypothetical protein